MNSYQGEFARLGITVLTGPKKAFNPFGEIRTIWINKHREEFKPDVIHAVALKPAIYTGIATRFFFEGAGCPRLVVLGTSTAQTGLCPDIEDFLHK